MMPCQVSDVDRIFDLEQRATSYGWSRSDLASSVASDHHCYKLARKGQILGHCVVQLIGAEMEILNIVIDRDLQGMGYGTFLIDSVLRLGRYRLVTEVWLEVRESNLGARKLYGQLGFIQSGIRKNYYRHAKGRENAVMICRSSDLS